MAGVAEYEQALIADAHANVAWMNARLGTSLVVQDSPLAVIVTTEDLEVLRGLATFPQDPPEEQRTIFGIPIEVLETDLRK